MFTESTFTAFLAAAQDTVTADYARFSPGRPAPSLSAERGRRYIRIVSDNGCQRSAFGFVDASNGDVLKADGWKRPAKGSRGHIADERTGTGRIRWTGVA